MRVFGKHRELFGWINSFASLVVISCERELPIGRKSTNPVFYLVANYENICKVRAICLIVTQLPEQLTKRLRVAFGYKH
jgi:hypothetical protein